jgi:hypothetical protein
MGATESKNVESVITRSIAKVSSEIIQTTQLSTDSSQVISVTNIHGDVHIEGNKFTQIATINMQALLNALSTETAQQALLTEVIQEAKSVTSGINLGQYANASNLMNLLIEATVSLFTTIKETCKLFLKQTQSIIVDRVEGDVYIKNNVFEELNNIMQNCVEDSISNNTLFQTLTTKLKQEATAKAEGISGWILVALLAIVIGLPIAGGVIGGVVILKFIFPLLFVAGAVLIVMYFVWTYKTIDVIGYSQGIETLCDTQGEVHSDIASAEDAKTLCGDDCAGYDWDSATKEATLFPTLTQECLNIMKTSDPDDTTATEVPTFFSGDTVPGIVQDAAPGDVYLDTETGDWYQMSDNEEWQSKGNLAHSEMEWGPRLPANPVNGEIFATYNPEFPSRFYIKEFDEDEDDWTDLHNVQGPGVIADAKIPNVSGIRVLKRRDWALYGGIAGLVVGILGSIYSFMMMDENFNPSPAEIY